MNREEWLQWRHKGIGSSDAPVIMGVSPWKTPLQLYEEKILPEAKEDDSNGYIKNRGNVIESKIRAQVELLHDEIYAPALCEDKDFPFLKVSLDGLSVDKKSFIEIKLLGEEDFALVRVGVVPEKYWPQVQDQFLVSGCEKGYLAGYLFDKEKPNEYDSSRLLIIEIEKDKEYCLQLLEAQVKFWDCVVSKRPPLPSSRDYKRLNGVAKLANRWKKVKEQIDKLNQEKDQLEDQILAVAEADGHPRFHCSGIQLMKISRQGNIDYKSIPELKGIDLEKYRKGGSVYWKMEVIKKKEPIQ